MTAMMLIDILLTDTVNKLPNLQLENIVESRRTSYFQKVSDYSNHRNFCTNCQCGGDDGSGHCGF